MPQETERLSWKEIFLSTKGPKNFKETILLFIKGIAMGIANIIPGVSGGTLALITGIYKDMLLAVKSLDLNTISHLKKLEIKKAASTIHLKFLTVLGLGAGLAIILLARIMNHVINNYAVLTWSFFFGLILASILFMGTGIKNWFGTGGISFIIGTVSSYVFVDLIPVSTPETWWFILFAGMITICTMILPGLSGAFLLLILGKYEYVTGALKNPFIPENFVTILIFCIGCLVGIIAFSRVILFMLAKYENVTMAMLTGIICGSLRKIWPWKEVLETKIIPGKVNAMTVSNVLPSQYDTAFFMAIGLIIIGFVLVLVLEKTAEKK